MAMSAVCAVASSIDSPVLLVELPGVISRTYRFRGSIFSARCLCGGCPLRNLIDIMCSALEELPPFTTMNEMIYRAQRVRVEDL
jgi:hypothetical protein